MKESWTFSNVLRIVLSVYLAGSLVYATVHLLGLGWFQFSDSSSLTESGSMSDRLEPVSVNQLQQKYHSAQIVTWTNAEGKQLHIVFYLLNTSFRWT